MYIKLSINLHQMINLHHVEAENKCGCSYHSLGMVDDARQVRSNEEDAEALPIKHGSRGGMHIGKAEAIGSGMRHEGRRCNEHRARRTAGQREGGFSQTHSIHEIYGIIKHNNGRVTLFLSALCRRLVV